MPFIYKIVNKINGKCYIGKTMFTIQERWKEHVKLISGAAAHISSVCKGNRKTAYHYRWSYL